MGEMGKHFFFFCILCSSMAKNILTDNVFFDTYKTVTSQVQSRQRDFGYCSISLAVEALNYQLERG